MLYRLIDHYDFKLNEMNPEKEDKMECFICYEKSCENELVPMKLNSQIYYVKKCSCDGYIHKKCMDLWFDKSKKCPVCRNYMSEKGNISVNIYSQGFLLVIAFIAIKKNIVKIITLTSIFFLLFSTMDFYYVVHNEKYLLE